MSAPEPRPYHHGDLRRALIAAARNLLEAEGPDALSLRAVARHAGVSPAAPYHHFKDKNELLEAVAEEGFSELAETLGRVFEETPAAERVLALAATYASFALHRHSLFQVMTAATRGRSEPPQPGSGLVRVVDMVHGAIEAASPEPLSTEDIELAGIAVLSSVHGLVELATFRLPGHLMSQVGGEQPFMREVLRRFGVLAGGSAR